MKRLAYVFCQLRFVNLVEIPEGYDLTWTLFILEAAPNLKELYMTVRCYLFQRLRLRSMSNFCMLFVSNKNEPVSFYLCFLMSYRYGIIFVKWIWIPTRGGSSPIARRRA